MGLEFGEGHFDRVQMGAVGRQEQEPGASRLEAVLCSVAFVAAEVIRDDNVGPIEGGRKLGLDIEVERGSGHGAVSPQRRKPAMKVCVPHRPNGAKARSRSPQSAWPRRRVILVLVDVSSTKTRRCGPHKVLQPDITRSG